MLDLSSDSGGPIVNLYALYYLWDIRDMRDIVLLRKGNCYCHEVSEIRNMYRCLILSGWQDCSGSGLPGHQNLLDAPTGKQSSCVQSLPLS